MSRGAKASAGLKISRAEARARAEVRDTALKMSEAGLSPGRSGNVSCRWQDGMLITPTAMRYEDITPGDIVFVDMNGEPRQGGRKPSSEWPFHKAIYEARGDAGAVVHCHSLNATALACARKPIPAFHYMVAVAGGKDIPLVPYATFGTAKLARLIKAAVKDRNACLLANHGQIAFGADLDDALELALEVETLAAQYLKVLSTGKPKLLSDAEMHKIVAKFYNYRDEN